MRTIGLALAAALCLAAPAFAQDEEPTCMLSLPVTAELVKEAGSYGFSGRAGSGAVPSVLVGALSSTRDLPEDQPNFFGSVVFVRDSDGGWRAFMPKQGEDINGVYATDAGAFVIVTMWGVEGPGNEWTLLRSSDALQTGACVSVPFPDTLNQPVWNMEFLSFHDLDINSRGRGEIIGVAEIEGRTPAWYVYRTRDGGATWGAPRRLSGRRDAAAGMFTPIVDQEAEAPADLVADLTSYAATR